MEFCRNQFRNLLPYFSESWILIGQIKAYRISFLLSILFLSYSIETPKFLFLPTCSVCYLHLSLFFFLNNLRFLPCILSSFLFNQFIYIINFCVSIVLLLLLLFLKKTPKRLNDDYKFQFLSIIPSPNTKVD